MRKMWTIASVLIAVVLISLSAMPVALAAPGGNSDNARLCQKGGWQSLARAESPAIAFVNQGECVRYGAQGGEIIPLFVGPTINISGGLRGYDGVISGTGFTPNTYIVSIKVSFYPYTSWDIRRSTGIWTDSNGEFYSEAALLFCPHQSSPSVTIIVEESTGVEVTRELSPEC